MRRSPTLAVLVVSFVVVFGACAEGEKVGSGVKVGSGDTGEPSGLRLGERTTTTEAAAQQAAATTAPPTTAATTKTTAAQSNATTTTAAASVLEITIIDRSQYEPPIAEVTAGQVVRWVNKDTIERQVVATDGAFASPKIAPGGSWEWKATKRGDHAYADPDVPFAAGARLRVS